MYSFHLMYSFLLVVKLKNIYTFVTNLGRCLEYICQVFDFFNTNIFMEKYLFYTITQFLQLNKVNKNLLAFTKQDG